MFKSSGATGEIRWSYLTAATFGPWQAEFNRLGGTVTATIGRIDAYRVSQAPLSLVLPFGRKHGRWPIHSLQIAGESLTAVVGPRDPS